MKRKLLKVTLALFATAWVGGVQAEVKTIFARTLWTFNDLSIDPFPSNTTEKVDDKDVPTTNTDLNGEGLLYGGNTNSSLVTLNSNVSSTVTFSDAASTSVTTTKVIELESNTANGWTSSMTSARTGETYNSTYARALAFNTSVPGTAYVVLSRSAGNVNTGATFELTVSYKGESGWTYATQSEAIPERYAQKELKLHCDYAGTFWIRASQKSNVHAILFVPDPVNVTVGEHLYTTYYNGTAYNQELPEGLTAYGVSSQVSARTGQTVTLSPYNVIPAGAGVILKGSEAKAYALNYTKAESTYTGENYMVGTATEIAELSYNNYVLVYDSEDGKVKFARSNGTGGKPTVPAGHAYLSSKVYNTSSGARPNYLFLEDSNESTGVSAISSQAEASDTWYTLGGQRIVAPTTHGVYIKNGKKIIIK